MFSLLVGLSGCTPGSSTPTPDVSTCDSCAASVLDVVPADGAVDVDLSPTIEVSVGAGNFVAAELFGPDGDALPGLPMGAESISFEPFDLLEPETSYTLVLKLGCGTENVEVCSEETVSFTTRAADPDPDPAPDNRWFIADDVPAGLATPHLPTLGNRPLNLQYDDQFGEPVELHQFYGKTVQLSLTAMWCAPCQEIAQDMADAGPGLASQDIQIVEILLDSVDGSPLTVADAEQWATTFGAQHPVLVGDPADWQDWLDAYSNTFPVLPILGPDLTVVEENNVPFDPVVLEAFAP